MVRLPLLCRLIRLQCAVADKHVRVKVKGMISELRLIAKEKMIPKPRAMAKPSLSYDS